MHPVFTSVLISTLGILIGRYLWQVAQHYTYLIHQGENPTTRIFWRAARLKSTPPSSQPSRPYSKSLTLSAYIHIALLICFWAVLYTRLGINVPTFFLACAAAGMLLLAMIDARCGLLPDALTMPLLWVGLGVAWAGQGLVTLDQAFLGAAAIYLALRLLGIVFRLIRHREGLGGGDPKLSAAIGAWLGWPEVFHVVFAGSVIGLMAALLLGRKWGGEQHPFGPSLVLGAFAVAVHKLLL
ncbi:prepilin peptidase [Alcaligenes sp.]|uniref:prepilin peptidase n=1 Tax=Alcaligenes sp. TaxID=512 RepID=UPI003D025592